MFITIHKNTTQLVKGNNNLNCPNPQEIFILIIITLRDTRLNDDLREEESVILITPNPPLSLIWIPTRSWKK